MKRAACACLAALILPQSAPPLAGARDEGGREALAAASAETQRLLEGFVHETGIPGAAFGVSLHGEVLFAAGFGWADRERRIPATPATRFRIASISKPLTAAAMARLHDAGVLDLDAPIQQYLPDFPEKSGTITARRLAGHLAGIRHNLPEEVWNTEQPHYERLSEALRLFQDDPLVVQPRHAMSYSTPGYTLLGAVIEAAAGTEYRELMRQSVFEPLGMQSTLVDDPRTDIPGRAAFYDFVDGEVRPSPYMDHSYKLPAGGYLSTIGDLLAFGSAHLTPGYLRESTLRMLTTPQRTSRGESTGYGLGWVPQADFEGRRTFGHGGNQPGARTQLTIWPDHGLVAVFLCNVRGAPISEDEVWTMTMPLLDALEHPGEWASRPEVEAVGEYDLTWLESGEPRSVRLELSDTEPYLRGSVLGPELQSYRIAAGRVSGKSLRLCAVHPDGMVSMHLALDGQQVHGLMTLGNDAGVVRGQRVPSLFEARAHGQAGRFEAATRVLEALVERLPDDGLAWNSLADLYLEAREYALAAAVFERAAEFGSDRAPSHFNAARAWARAGREAQALDCLELAVAAGAAGLPRLLDLPDFQGLHGNPRFEQLSLRQCH